MSTPGVMVAFVAALSPGALALLLLAVVSVAIEVGFWIGARVSSSGASDGPSQGITLTLVGLLLGFMFSFAAQRYDVRRDVAVREANAIGTTYLRADFLEEPAASQMRRELARYLDLRIAYYRERSVDARRRTSVETLTLQRRLWALATTSPLTEPTNARAALLTSTMNDVFDRAEDQEIAFAAGVPPPIVLLLFVVVAISGWLLGFGLGRAGKRDLVYTVAFSVLVSFVTYSIADLSQARTGLIQTSDAPLLDVKATFATPAP
ncbi:MAG TPA: hypothetical protein VMA36_14330 [Candidatus Limnocylindria bacterium]|jgi:hypothetical protein|nr:hypothetical protein [Candidatus Limnocylindria bacterium]